jgi:YVTN family beta-propeller protein
MRVSCRFAAVSLVSRLRLAGWLFLLTLFSAPLPAAAAQGSSGKPAGTYFVAYRTQAHVSRSQPQVFHEIAEGLREFLKSRNIALVNESSPVMTEALLPTDTLLNRTRQAGGSHLLYVTVDRPMAAWVKITVQCFDLSGKVLWEESTSDKWRVSGKGGVEKSLEKMKDKLVARLGGPGLEPLEPGAPPAVAAQPVPAASAPEQPPSPAREWWLTVGGEAFVLLEPGATYRAKFEVGENARNLVLSPDGSLAAISSDGTVKTHVTLTGTVEHWPEGGSQSSITLVKKSDYKLVGRYPVPFRPYSVKFTDDGKALVIVSLGQVSNDKKKHIAPQIGLLDVASGKLRNQVELASEPSDVWHVSNRVIVPCRGMKKQAEAPPELVIYDTATGGTQKVALPSSPLGWHDTGSEGTRYLELEDGVLVVNLEGKPTGPPVEAGKETVFFVPGPQGKQFFLAGKSKDQGRLVILEAGRVLKTLETPPPKAILLDATASRLILYGKGQGLILDSQTFAEQARIPLPNLIAEAQLHPAGKRLYVNEPSGQVSVIDLETKQQIARFASGRGGAKFFQNVAVPMLMALASARTYQLTGAPGPTITWTGPLPIQSLAFSPSGNFLYVFNTQTNDVTIVNTRDHTVLRKVGLGPLPFNPEQARELAGLHPWQSADGRYLISCQGDKVVVLDTEKGEVLTEQTFKVTHLRYEPSLGLVFVQHADGTDVYHAAPFDYLKDLRPSYKLAFAPKHVKLSERAPGRFQPPERLVFRPEARRFFVFSPNGASVYDYDLKLISEVEGVSGSSDVGVLP